MRELLEIPVAASAHAGDIDRMTVLIHWLMALLFIGSPAQRTRMPALAWPSPSGARASTQTGSPGATGVRGLAMRRQPPIQRGPMHGGERE